MATDKKPIVLLSALDGTKSTLCLAVLDALEEHLPRLSTNQLQLLMVLIATHEGVRYEFLQEQLGAYVEFKEEGEMK